MGQQVDIGIITIRQDEFEALQLRLRLTNVVSGLREYNVGELATRPGDRYRVALVRCARPGNIEAQSAARDLIEDLDPQWLLLVGIAGTIPTDELTLGDVVVSTQILDFNVGALDPDGSREYAVTGGPLLRDAARVVTNLPARGPELGPWNVASSIRLPRPDVKVRHDACSGTSDWQLRVHAMMTHHFVREPARDPIFAPGAIASSDLVHKNPMYVVQWLRAARQIRAVEMEAAGVFHVSWSRDVPLVVIRGISDVIGFKRDDAWTHYACESAAAFARAFLDLGPILSRAAHGPPKPPPQRSGDAPTQALFAQLDSARERRECLKDGGHSIADVVEEIRRIKLELRGSGRLRAGDDFDDGRYQLIEAVGKGGFGTVWRAFDKERGCDVAVKVLHTGLAGDPVRVDRFFRGARIMAELDHPSVVRVLRRRCEDYGFQFFVMEYIGDNLADAVVKGLPLPRAMSMMFAVGDALAGAHKHGHVHRDVKPENILLADDGSARLTDFDLVHAADSHGDTKTGMLGTIVYAAPEQLYHAEDVDARADVYALGMTLVFVLHGAQLPPLAVRDPRQFIEKLQCSRGMKTVLRKAVAYEPAERYVDAAAFCLDLSALPEVRDGFAALCTATNWPLLLPIIRFHGRRPLSETVEGAIVRLREYHAARAAAASGELDEAAALFQKTLATRPKDVATLAAYVELLARTGPWPEYVDRLESLAELGDDAGKRDALFACGTACQEQLRDFPRAQQFFQRVLHFGPHREAAARLEVVLAGMQDSRVRAEGKRQLAEQNADSAERARLFREAAAEFEQDLHDVPMAFRALQPALQAEPRHLETAAWLARIAFELGRWQPTVERFAAGDNAVAVLETLSVACGQAAKWGEAGDLLHWASRLAPAADRARLLLAAGRIYLDQAGDRDGAKQSFAEAFALAPEDAAAARVLAALYFEDKDWAKLLPVIERVVRDAASEADLQVRCELHYRAARAAHELGKHERALCRYQAAFEIDPHHSPTLLGRADLSFQHVDWPTARTLYQEILDHHRDAIGIDDAARCWYRLGVAHASLREPDDAIRCFERALELEPSHRDSLQALIEQHTDKRRWDGVIDYKLRLADISPEREGAALRHQAARIKADLLSPRASVESLGEAIVPDRLAQLQTFRTEYTKTENWTMLVPILEESAALEDDPVRAAEHLLAAAELVRKHLQDPERAIALYEAALDAFYRRPDRLSPDHRKRARDAFLGDLVELIRDRKGWKGVDGAYRRMIDRLPRSDELRVRLQHNLGDIRRKCLRDLPGAIEAYEEAHTHDPGDQERAKTLTTLYRETNRLDKAIAFHRGILRTQPYRFDAYRALEEIYRGSGQLDKAWCVCAALVYLDRAEPVQAEFFRQHQPWDLSRAKTSTAWQTRLAHPDADRTLSAVFALMWAPEAVRAANLHKQRDLRRKDRRDAATDPHPSLKLFDQVRRMLGVPEPAVFLGNGLGASDVDLVNHVEDDEPCPAVVLRPQSLQQRLLLRDQAALFALRLTLLWPEYYLRRWLSDDDLETTAWAAIRIAAPTSSIAIPAADRVERRAEALSKLTDASAERLRALVDVLVERSPPFDVRRWRNGVDATAHRVALVACGDLEIAARVISAEPVRPGDWSAEERKYQLLRFSISEDYFAIRAHLGLAIE